MNVTTWNLTNSLPMPGAQRVDVTTQKLLETCAQMDAQAYGYAIAGFVLSIIAIVYFGRVRTNLLKEEYGPSTVAFADKFLLTLLALLFAGVIVRLARAG